MLIRSAPAPRPLCHCVVFLGIFTRPGCRSCLSTAGDGWEGHPEHQPWTGTPGQPREGEMLGVAVGLEFLWAGIVMGLELP